MFLYTIGFTGKTAEKFFKLIEDNKITMVVDVRLNNATGLAGYSKYPDIKYFLKEICNCKYKHDLQFAPENSTLRAFKPTSTKQKREFDKEGVSIDWNGYCMQFDDTMAARNIRDYIEQEYSELIESETLCLLCSEDTDRFCHRRLVAEIFEEVFESEKLVVKPLW